VKRLSRKCGILDILHSYRPPRPATGMYVYAHKYNLILHLILHFHLTSCFYSSAIHRHGFDQIFGILISTPQSRVLLQNTYHLSGQRLVMLLWSYQVPRCIFKSQNLVPILANTYPVHNFTYSCFKAHFTITNLHICLRSVLFPKDFRKKHSACTSLPSVLDAKNEFLT
jgi:hypothetical protein